MKLRVIAILGGILMAGSLSAQTLTNVINEFNAGVEMLNNQEYESSVEHFNKVLELAEVVGDSAADLKIKAMEQIPLAYYRKAIVLLKQKQYEDAIPYLEQTIELSKQYNNNEESRQKASGYLLQSYMMAGQNSYKNDSYQDALGYMDKALAMNDNIYQAHQLKGMIYLSQDKTDDMLEEFNKAKEGAGAKNDTKTVDEINQVINEYYDKIIKDEFEAVDPEDNDYTYVIEACENALAANEKNPRALYYLALVHNKMVEYDAAIDYAQKALEYETNPVWISAIYYELGYAYQNIVEYDKACEALKKVVEEPFRAQAERKMGMIPGCE
jgi:tetratricopeptide (TPR) repeat protein